MIFVAGTAFSQKLHHSNDKMLLLKGAFKQPQKGFYSKGTVAKFSTAKPIIAPDFYVTQLGFFCKQEIKFEKATKIPFRFRLGTVDDCDRLEGKYKRSPVP